MKALGIIRFIIVLIFTTLFITMVGLTGIVNMNTITRNNDDLYQSLFYERFGFEFDGTKKALNFGRIVNEIRYKREMKSKAFKRILTGGFPDV